MSEVQEVKQPERAPVSLARYSMFEHTNATHVITAEPGTTLEDLLVPNFWSFVAVRFHPRDKIHVNWEDGSAYAELLVLDRNRISASVDVLIHRTYGPSVPFATVDGWEVKFRGPHKKWSVINQKSRQVLHEGLETEAEAMSALARHLKK